MEAEGESSAHQKLLKTIRIVFSRNYECRSLYMCTVQSPRIRSSFTIRCKSVSLTSCERFVIKYPDGFIKYVYTFFMKPNVYTYISICLFVLTRLLFQQVIFDVFFTSFISVVVTATDAPCRV